MFSAPTSFDASLLDVGALGAAAGMRAGSSSRTGALLLAAAGGASFLGSTTMRSNSSSHRKSLNVKEGVALQAYVHECGLHSGQHALYATFVNVADDALLGFAALPAFDVKLCDESVLDDGDLLFASVDADDHLFCHWFRNFSK
jgi:hypothetical protein